MTRNMNNVSGPGGFAAFLRTDLSRMLRFPLLWWSALLAAVLPASFQVMLGPMEGFDAWGMVTGLPSSVVPMLMGIVLAIFVAQEYHSGFVKGTFTQNPRKGKWLAAKICTGGIAGCILIAAYVVGAALFALMADASFESGLLGLIVAVVSKAALMFFFAGLFLCADVIAKRHAWLAVTLTLLVGMLFFPALLATAIMPAAAGAGLSLVAAPLGAAGFCALASFLMGRQDLV